ncbi:hypothetical protein CGCA056_v011111 [Colletotrichum aenigma]|uniref:uncharacterized protein n=1 Tax=Colletotrichum aenigma TaxID=1215731 RepID=UPI0018722909|nr:uncharacterized protein CGCA056_v011111 [Colletotrichum aenigma]KAF5517411.1 hypothetical protein CGCA056_v011111 [Colletotrichum aenigma]
METTLDMTKVSYLFTIYKSSTNCFLRWLWCAYHQADPRSAAGVEPFRTTSKIIEVSHTVYNAGRPVPGSVLGALRDAIRHRKSVGQFYGDAGKANRGHRQFIRRLEQTLAILEPLEAQNVPFEDYLGRQEDERPRGILEQQPNPFAALIEGLNISPHASPPRASDMASPTAPTPSTPNKPESKTEPKKPEEFILEDDDIGVAYHAAHFLVDMHQFHAHLEETWKAAGEGKIPLLAAAFQSNCVAYLNCYKTPRVDCSALCFFSEHNCTCRQCNRIRNFIQFRTNSSNADVYVKLARRLWMIASIINDYGRNLGESYRPPEVHGRPAICNLLNCPDQFRTPPSSEIPHLENFLSTENQRIVRDLMDAINNRLDPLKRGITVVEMIKGNFLKGFVDICEALFDFGQSFLLQNTRVVHGELVVVMSMFLLVEKTTMQYGGLRGSACRAQGLRFAMDMYRATEPVLETVKQCHPDSSMGLETLRLGLNIYGSDEQSGIYHESPWTVGCHMLDMLTAAIRVGGEVCRYWAVLRTTLHLYNALRIRGFDEFQIPQIPVLEELSGMFLQEVFLGTVPKLKFLSSFRLAVFNSHWVKHSGKFQLERGLDLLTPSIEAPYWGLCNQHYTNHQRNGEFLCKLYKTEKPVALCPCKRCEGKRAAQVQANLQKVKKARDLLRKDTWYGYACKSREAVLTEVQGPAPIARVNFFALFRSCAAILESFGSLAIPVVQNKYKEQGLWKDWMDKGLSISRFAAEDLMEILDAMPGDTRRDRERLAKKPLFKHAVSVFKSLERTDVTLEEFMWNI